MSACQIHGKDHARRARTVRAQANASPATVCWRDGLTLAEHAPHKSGAPARWQAGHTRDIDCETCGRTHGDPTSALLPEASTCNAIAGGDVTQGLSNRVVNLWD